VRPRATAESHSGRTVGASAAIHYVLIGSAVESTSSAGSLAVVVVGGDVRVCSAMCSVAPAFQPDCALGVFSSPVTYRGRSALVLSLRHASRSQSAPITPSNPAIGRPPGIVTTSRSESPSSWESGPAKRAH